MKTLVLVRHAKSSWKDETLNDLQRPLKKSGETKYQLSADSFRLN